MNKDMDILQLFKMEYSCCTPGKSETRIGTPLLFKIQWPLTSISFLSYLPHASSLSLSFLFWKQEPNKLAQTCLASSLYKVLHPKELDRFVLRSVWLSIQSSRPKAQCPVSREGLAYMTTLCERDIEWGSNDQPPGLPEALLELILSSYYYLLSFYDFQGVQPCHCLSAFRRLFP